MNFFAAIKRRVPVLRTIFGVALACPGSIVLAAAATKIDAPENLIVSQGLQVILALAVTLATIWGLSRLVIKKRWHRNFDQQQIKIIDSLALGARDRVMLIEVENQRVLVASTPGNLRSLHVYEKSAGDTFASALQRATAGGVKNKNAASLAIDKIKHGQTAGSGE